MTSSTLRALGCLLLALSAGVVANAQNQPLKKPSTISGKISLKGTGVPGITMGAIYRGASIGKTRFTAVTDAQGNYRMTELPAGTYELGPVAPQYVLTTMNARKMVILEEGENLDGMDFPLVRGGVITGKVTNADGQPLIEEQIHLSVIEANRPDQPFVRMNMYFYQTDDRGIYRVFGLPPGKYTVSTGTPENRIGFGSRSRFKYKQTYHPATTDPSQATVIELAEGGEANNVDIVVSLQQATYSVSGRIVDGETGRPIPNARYGLTKIEENGSSGTSGPVTNALGEFKIDAMLPGKYMITLDQTMNDPVAERTSHLFAEAVRFDITDHDVTDLVIKTGSGASVSGVIIFDGMDPKTVKQKFGELMIMVQMQSGDRFGGGSGVRPVKVGADGSFTVGGLAAGDAHFGLFSQMAAENGRRLEVARIERDGMVQQRTTLEIKDREQVTGVRLIVNARTGTVQGIVKLENGSLDSGRLHVQLTKIGEKSGYGMMLDARGHFRMGGLPAGTYEITATAFIATTSSPPTTKQQIVITDDQVTDVTLTLDLKSNPDQP